MPTEKGQSMVLNKQPVLLPEVLEGSISIS